MTFLFTRGALGNVQKILTEMRLFCTFCTIMGTCFFDRFSKSGQAIPGNPREQHQPGLPPAPGDGEAVRLDDAKVGLDVVGGGAAAESVGEGVEALELPVRESPQLRVQQGRPELPRPCFFKKCN